MDGFCVNTIEPNRENAERIIDLRKRDFRRVGLPLAEAKKLADKNNETQVEGQINKLKFLPERYLGVIALKNNKLVGYSDIHEWTLHDQLPFSSEIEKFTIKSILKVAGSRPMKDIIGVHELLVDEKINERHDIVSMLLDKVIKIANSKELYLPQYEDDCIVPTLYKNDFGPTNRRNESKGIVKQLFVHPSSASKFTYEFGDIGGLKR